MNAESSFSHEKLQQLKSVREALLHLHQALLFSEREEYEQYHGQIQSKGEFFRLVLDHDWFSWLRPMSQLIVYMDGTMDNQESLDDEKIDAMLQNARQLLTPAQDGTTPEKRYYEAIQREPRIALMHSAISELLPPSV